MSYADCCKLTGPRRSKGTYGTSNSREVGGTASIRRLVIVYTSTLISILTSEAFSIWDVVQVALGTNWTPRHMNTTRGWISLMWQSRRPGKGVRRIVEQIRTAISSRIFSATYRPDNTM